MKKFYLNIKDMKTFMDALDNSPEPNESFKKLMSTPAPWEKIKGYAPEDSSKWKCNWIECAHGMGLAGSGKCSANGTWGIKKCGEFEEDDAWQKRNKYQCRYRFYLDEYPNQEKLREEWFKKTNEYKDWIKAFMTFASAGFSVSDFYIKKPKNIYDHFLSRFNKRN